MYVEDSRKYSFCQSFRKKNSNKIAMIIVSYQWHYKVSNPPENVVDSYFIAGFFFVTALTNLATDLNILWKANPAVK